jgi:hypothetical protein
LGFFSKNRFNQKNMPYFNYKPYLNMWTCHPDGPDTTTPPQIAEVADRVAAILSGLRSSSEQRGYRVGDPNSYPILQYWIEHANS